GAMPSEPDNAAAKSERMSAWRLEATTLSMAAGLSTMRVVIASTSTRSVLTSGKDRKSTRLNSSHSQISYAVFCLKKKKNVNNLGRGRDFAINISLQSNRIIPTLFEIEATGTITNINLILFMRIIDDTLKHLRRY